MSDANMKQVLCYARRLETSVTMGGCPFDRLFMTDKLCVSDMLIVEFDDVDSSKIQEYDYIHKMRVDVLIRRARRENESGWNWKPEHFDVVTLCFFHHDFDLLFAKAAEWLDNWNDTDTETQLAWKRSEGRRETRVFCIKYPQVGRIRHYTNPLPVKEY